MAEPARQGETPAVIPDTNVFVAAGFNRSSDSARIVEAIGAGRLRLVWNEATRREVERLLRQVPRLSWERVAGLFREEDRYQAETFPERFRHVLDPDDRKFAALSAATGVTLVTRDDDLLRHRAQAAVPIMTPDEFVRRSGMQPVETPHVSK